MTASMLHNEVQVVLLTMSHAVAWGCTAAPHTAAGNAGSSPATSTIASTRTTHLLLLLLLLWDERSQAGSHEEYMQGHAGRAMFSKRSNKEACNMKAQGHAAHMSTQDSVAGAAWYCGSVQACLMTRLYKHIVNYALAKRCLVGTRSM
jgi:hypothetical protein